MPSCSVENVERPYVNSFNRRVRERLGVTFASVFTRVRHRLPAIFLSDYLRYHLVLWLVILIIFFKVMEHLREHTEFARYSS